MLIFKGELGGGQKLPKCEEGYVINAKMVFFQQNSEFLLNFIGC
jgi:hypothetical protein